MKPIPSSPEYLIAENGIVTKEGKPLKINRCGSVRVAIRRKMRLVSELLAETYLEMPIDKKHSVIYLDGNSMNTELSNLMWVDQHYSQIDFLVVEFSCESFYHAAHLEVKQYYVSESGKILNFAKQRIINPAKDSMGYFRFSYYVPDQSCLTKKTVAVHILVYQTLRGVYDNTKYEINHIDGNKINNNISNLELVDHQENVRHAVRTNLKKVKYGEDHIAQVIFMLQSDKSWTEIFSEYLQPHLGLTKQAAFSLINGIANNENAYAEKCQNLGFVKGSTTRANARTR